MTMNPRRSNAPLERAVEPAPGCITHTLPPLPYDYAALEPAIDAHTLTLHHDKHHAAYVTNLNAALHNNPELQTRSAEWLLYNLDQVPQDIREAVRHNAGGHVNHSLFWQVMSHNGGGAPSGPLADALHRDFGSFERFKAEFDTAGEKLFGSGWVWLVRAQNPEGQLQIITTTGHDAPFMQGMQGGFPLLVNDVWEHAYYLKYENRRIDYLRSWWSIVHWDEVARRFAQHVKGSDPG